MKTTDEDRLAKKFPQFFVVDDVPVRLELEGGEVAGYNWLENPYPIGKTMIEGKRIDKEEYVRLVKEMKK